MSVDPRAGERYPRGNYCTRGARFGVHSSEENFRNPYYGRVTFLAYFTGGTRAWDIREPQAPHEVGFYVPEANANTDPSGYMTNNVEVDSRGFIYATDRNGSGLDILKAFREASPGGQVLLISGFGTLETGLLCLPALAVSLLLTLVIGFIAGLEEWALLMGPVIGFMAVGYAFYKLLKGNPDRRTRFDRASQQLTVEERVRRSSEYRTLATKPLSRVVGVQVLYTGHRRWSSETTGGCYFTYEMNLILDDGTRFHLCTHSDWEWFRREGARLAEFLKTPFIDQLAWHAD